MLQLLIAYSVIGDELPALPGWLGLTPYGIIVALILLYTMQLNRGKLYTQGQHLSIVNPLLETIEKKDELIGELLSQNSTLINGGEITSDFFRRVPVRMGPRRNFPDEDTSPHRPNSGDNDARGDQS